MAKKTKQNRNVSSNVRKTKTIRNEIDKAVDEDIKAIEKEADLGENTPMDEMMDESSKTETENSIQTAQSDVKDVSTTGLDTEAQDIPVAEEAEPEEVKEKSKTDLIKEVDKDERLRKNLISKKKKINKNGVDDDKVIEKATRFNPDLTIGLDDEQINRRIAEGLTNKDTGNQGKTIFQIFISNIFTYFNMLLIAIAVLLVVFGKARQIFFLFIALVNTAIGVYQEIKSKMTIDKLKLVTAQNVKVVRNGKTEIIHSSNLVLDDVYTLNNGDQIPADSSLLNGNIEVNESLLTGESQPIKKTVGDKIFAGSFIVSGSCIVKVEKVGRFNYANSIQNKAKEYQKPQSELLRSLNSLIGIIGFAIIPLGICLFLSQFLPIIRNSAFVNTSENMYQAVSTAVSKTAGSIVGMIPSGMYLLTSIALAVGVMNLAKKNTLVQDIYCIEMLARVNTLCLDKTGTLTDGTMKCSEVLIIDNRYDLKKVMGSYLNSFQESNQTSIALMSSYPLRSDYHMKTSIPFSSARKYSAVTFFDEGTFVLGAPEYVYKTKDRTVAKYIADKESAGYRVVMLCHGDFEIQEGELQGKVSPIALFVLVDHIRREAPETIKWFTENGVDIKIISGDNPLTVSEIAKKCNVPHADRCVSLEGLPVNEVASLVDQYTVFGRVTPEQKAMIVSELKRRKRTVGMTGDGVNDILAMKQADCSIAMANGSSAARNVAHLVLLDSNFASMPAVVAEGRRVVNNVQRSSSLFLMKTIFTIVMTLIVVLSAFIPGYAMKYPFETNNIMIMEMIGIGVPSFFLALQKNNTLISGHFLKNTFSRAIPGAFCLLIAILINYALRGSGFLEIGTTVQDNLAFTTFCSITMSIVSLGMVYNACAPFNTYRFGLFAGTLTGFLLLTFVLPFIPALSSTVPPEFEQLSWNLSMELTGTSYRYMNKIMFLVLVIYAMGMPSLCTIFIDMFAKMRGEKPNSILFSILQNTFEKRSNRIKEKKAEKRHEHKDMAQQKTE